MLHFSLSKLVVALVGINVIAEAASTLGSHLDAWAPVANTALLVALAILARRNGAKIDETHQSVHSTAQVALTAASAAAEAERVMKAIGSQLRHEDPAVIAPTPPDPPGPQVPS